ncbi:MAG: alcohol dehydrogenase catalytic domain-containing protein [Dehalococcoidales bacterium]|nr:alcohol dehydrogenase catalytic domain-containing protein [Dehalococcoidales bacterium]
MKAVVIYGQGDYRYEDVPTPKAGEGEVIVKTGRCGICAADPKIFHGLGFVAKAAFRNVPIVAGHEFIGEVVEMGPGAAEKWNLKIGDKAIAEQIVPCGECAYCRQGNYHLCNFSSFFGVAGAQGGWAEYIKYPKKSIIWKVPNEMPWEIAVAIEPLACAIHGVQKAKVQFSDTVVLMGAGAIGLFMVQLLRLKGPKQIIVSDIDEYRLSLAKKLGADIVINPQKEDIVKKVRELTDKVGCDVVIEATGFPPAVEAALSMLRKQGRLMEFGVFADKTAIDFTIIGDIKELEVTGSHLAPHTYPIAIRYLAQGLVKTGDIVTHNFPLKDVARAMETADKKLDRAIKVTMTP